MDTASPHDTRRVLIVRGGWGGHDPVGTTEAVIPFLREHGFAVDVHESTAVYADADAMASVDLIVQCISMGTISAEEFTGLRRAVEAGTGLAGWHGGIVDSFRDCADYLALVGGQFTSHPPMVLPSADGPQLSSFVPHRLEFTPAAAEHPITQGLDDVELITEQYWVLTDDLCDVLATTTITPGPDRPWQRPVTCPAVWTRQWGDGRIAVLTPGHDLATVQEPTVRTLIERSLLWAARTASRQACRPTRNVSVITR